MQKQIVCLKYRFLWFGFPLRVFVDFSSVSIFQFWSFSYDLCYLQAPGRPTGCVWRLTQALEASERLWRLQPSLDSLREAVAASTKPWRPLGALEASHASTVSGMPWQPLPSFGGLIGNQKQQNTTNSTKHKRRQSCATWCRSRSCFWNIVLGCPFRFLPTPAWYRLVLMDLGCFYYGFCDLQASGSVGGFSQALKTCGRPPKAHPSLERLREALSTSTRPKRSSGAFTAQARPRRVPRSGRNLNQVSSTSTRPWRLPPGIEGLCKFWAPYSQRIPRTSRPYS